MTAPSARWFAGAGWEPFEFQHETWRAFAEGRSGLLHAPTGYGKTYAVWFGALDDWAARNPDWKPGNKIAPLELLWITPLRALATDTTEALRRPVDDLGLPWTVERRTGDASQSIKARTRKNPPTALVITPESLSLLLSYPDTREKLAHLRTVIVDEWHELLGTKRGVQTELALARLRAWNPSLRTWGVSATLGNIEEARDVLLGTESRNGVLVRGNLPKEVVIETLAPETIERFPWAGHLGLKVLPDVIAAIERAKTTLLFTNARSQAEQWHEAILAERPEWGDVLALHHGSLDRAVRLAHEDRLRAGELKCVVCTSSLDLGVDFSPVEQVIQVGSPKGIARLMQRAGRSGHQPGAASRLLGVPTHAFELVEFAAARDAAARLDIESRDPLELCLDVLVQHIVTVAHGGGFDEADLLDEVRRTHAFRALEEEQWSWCLDFCSRGGPSLHAYPEYARIMRQGERWVGTGGRTARLHRMGIGTITSDAAVDVRFARGTKLGTVEESFAARLRPGDTFLFAGRQLEFIRLRAMTATVRLARGRGGPVPRWMGGRMPLSSQLARGVRSKLESARAGRLQDPEMRLVAPLLEVQRTWSHVPAMDELLVERIKTRDGIHHFLYPFAGRLAHEGLGPLIAWRIARDTPATFSLFQTDYGLELLTPSELDLDEGDWRRLLSPGRLEEDFLACLNASELAKRQFRGIARVAGLVFQGYPGQQRTARQLQVSSGVLFEVFARFDPGNLLLDQARREVLQQQFELRRLAATLDQAARMRIVLRHPPDLTPFAFPIWAERTRETVSTERWTDRLARMQRRLESTADGEARRVAG